MNQKFIKLTIIIFKICLFYSYLFADTTIEKSYSPAFSKKTDTSNISNSLNKSVQSIIKNNSDTIYLNNLYINDIIIVRNPVFYDYDATKGRRRIFEFLNKLHVLTLERTILNDVLFEKGEILNIELIDNTERKLRSRDYIHKAEISITNVSDTLVDIHLETTDQWSTVIGTSYKKNDHNENTLKVILKETNIFGTGKTFKFKKDVLNIDKSKEFEYYDDHFLETNNLKLNYAYNQTADYLRRKFVFGKDFASDFDNFSYYFNVKSFLDYKHNDRITENFFELYISNKRLKNRVELHFRLHQLENNYKNDKTVFNYFFSGINLSSTRYIKETNIFSFGIVEDIRIGYEFLTGFKIITEALGASLNAWGFETYFEYTKNHNNHFFFVDLFNDYVFANEYSTYKNKFNFNFITKFNDNFNYRSYLTFKKRKCYKDINYYGLGFNNRLRGYTNNFLENNKYLVLNNEFTYFFSNDFLDFFRPAITLLYDVGRTYDLKESVKFKHFYHNIGLSLKFIMYKVDSVQELNITIAQPLKLKDKPYFSISTSFDL